MLDTLIDRESIEKRSVNERGAFCCAKQKKGSALHEI
jgi:hypothetical protein